MDIRHFQEYGPRDGNIHYSGVEHEYSLFGAADTKNERYVSAMEKLKSKGGYLNFRDSVELAKHLQPANPENPSKSFLRDFLFDVQDVLSDLGLAAEVRAYTAVGTPLDKLHGVDAFLAIDMRGKEFLVTLDATLNPEKLKEGHKADLIIGELPEPTEGSEQEKLYLDLVGAYAELAVKVITEKMEGTD